jgi:hypothetical protein
MTIDEPGVKIKNIILNGEDDEDRKWVISFNNVRNVNISYGNGNMEEPFFKITGDLYDYKKSIFDIELKTLINNDFGSIESLEKEN